MPLSPLEAAGFAAFGCLIGSYGTLIGAGGGFLVVPVLMLLMGVPHEVAAGTSLVVVLFNAASGTWAYARRRLVDWRTAALFASATVPGSLMGPRLLRHVPQSLFQASFGILLLGVAAWMLFKPAPPADACVRTGRVRRSLRDAEGRVWELSFDPFWGVLLSFIAGFLSSMLGIGGGILHVPVLIYALGFPAALAVATSQAALVVSAAFGVGGHAWLDHVLWGPALAMGGGAVLGAQAGAWLSGRIATPALLRALAAALGLVGLRCLWAGLG